MRGVSYTSPCEYIYIYIFRLGDNSRREVNHTKNLTGSMMLTSPFTVQTEVRVKLLCVLFNFNILCLIDCSDFGENDIKITPPQPSRDEIKK